MKEFVEEYQCPGCTHGSDTMCGRYKTGDFGQACVTHSGGTFVVGAGKIHLGLPKGFNRPGPTSCEA